MADLTDQEATDLFNNISKAMQEDDNGTLSSLLAVETPKDGEQPTQDPPLEEELEELEDKDTQRPLEEEEEGDKTPEDSDKKADKPEDKKEELTPEATRLAELQAQLEAVKKDNQALRSQAGRVPNIQRRLTQLDKELEALRSASPSSQTSTKIKPKVDKLLEGIKETDPALADSVAQAIAAAMEGVDEEMRTREEKTLTLLRGQEASAYEDEQAARLLSLYPNAPQVFASPHWAEWKKKQPDHILELARSTNADAVAMAFKQYAEDMVALHPELAKKAEEVKDPAKDTVDPAKNEAAKKLEQERLRKQKTEANLGTAKSGARATEPKDPQLLFEHFSKQIAEEMKGK